MTRPVCLAAAACALALAALLVGCAAPAVPAELPKPPDDYPCTDASGKRFDCSAGEWMFQKLTEKRKPD